MTKWKRTKASRKSTSKLLSRLTFGRQNLLHIETLNMMTKYQLVFVKLETTMFKICANIEAKKKLRVKKGFLSFKNNVVSCKSQQI